MATYTVAAKEVGTPAFAMVASAVDTVTIGNGNGPIEIISDGSAAVWYTLDGSTPAVGSAKSYYIPASPAVDSRTPSGETATVKLISAGTPTVRVQRGW